MRKRGSESSELLDGKAVGNLQTTKPRELGQGPERTVIDPDITEGEMTELSEPAKRCETRKPSWSPRSPSEESEAAKVVDELEVCEAIDRAPADCEDSQTRKPGQWFEVDSLTDREAGETFQVAEPRQWLEGVGPHVREAEHPKRARLAQSFERFLVDVPSGKQLELRELGQVRPAPGSAPGQVENVRFSRDAVQRISTRTVVGTACRATSAADPLRFHPSAEERKVILSHGLRSCSADVPWEIE